MYEFQMVKLLKLCTFGVDQNLSGSKEAWKQWRKLTLENCLKWTPEVATKADNQNSWRTLCHQADMRFISVVEIYVEAMNLLNKTYTQEKSEIYVRYILATRKQQTGETFNQFVQIL